MSKIKQLKFFEQSSLKAVQEEFNTLLTNKNLKQYIYLNLLLLGIDFLLLALFWHKLPPVLPLLYSRPWGEQQLIPKGWFFILPLGCLLVNLINFRLASFLFKKELLLSQILVVSSLVICALTSITLWKIFLIIL